MSKNGDPVSWLSVSWPAVNHLIQNDSRPILGPVSLAYLIKKTTLVIKPKRVMTQPTECRIIMALTARDLTSSTDTGTDSISPHLFRSLGPLQYPFGKKLKREPNPRRELAWNRRKCANAVICRFHFDVLSIFMQRKKKKEKNPLRIWIPPGTAMLVCSLSMKSRKS